MTKKPHFWCGFFYSTSPFYLLSLFDLAGFEAFGADVDSHGCLVGVDDADPLDVGLKSPAGTACDLTAGSALDPRHTAPCDVTAMNSVLFTNVTNSSHINLNFALLGLPNYTQSAELVKKKLNFAISS